MVARSVGERNVGARLTASVYRRLADVLAPLLLLALALLAPADAIVVTNPPD